MTFERKLAFWATTVCALPVLAWVSMFASNAVTNKPEDWASFGSYIGGALTPSLRGPLS